MPAPDIGPKQHAEALAAIIGRFGDRARNIKFPSDDLPAWHLYLTDNRQAFVTPDGQRVIDEWAPVERVMGFLFDLHAHLLTGETGERVAGFVSLGGVFMVITGLVLWWPARRKFSLSNMWPRGKTRRKMIRWHRDLGIVFTPLLLVLLLTGSGMIFYQTTMAILNGLFGAPPPQQALPPARAAAGIMPVTADDIARVQSEFPDARLVFYAPPRRGDTSGAGLHVFRLKQPCEIHPNGRTYVHLSPQGRAVVQTTDACAAAGGQKAQNLLYPLHAGKIGSLLYKWLVFVGGLALAALAMSGIWAYARKLTRGERRRRVQADAAPF